MSEALLPPNDHHTPADHVARSVRPSAKSILRSAQERLGALYAERDVARAEAEMRHRALIAKELEPYDAAIMALKMECQLAREAVDKGASIPPRRRHAELKCERSPDRAVYARHGFMDRSKPRGDEPHYHRARGGAFDLCTAGVKSRSAVTP